MTIVRVKGESTLGLPFDFEEVALEKPSLEEIMAHYRVDEKIRTHLLPVVNDEIATPDRVLAEGDTIILNLPYSGG